jgi:uncharacterized protein (TIGR00266 family)
MQITIQNRFAFASALVQLDRGERFVSEAGGMIEMTADLELSTTTQTRGGGGLLKGLKRLLAAESFFLSHFHAVRSPGQVRIAPELPGDIERIDLDGDTWLIEGGAFLGAGPDVEVDASFGGMKSFLGGEGLFFVRVSGQGPVLVSAFGGIFPIEVEGAHVVDTGHVVAFPDRLRYRLATAGGWKSFLFSGEGLVFQFDGHGRVLCQSHDAGRFGRLLGPKLPARRA